MLVLIFAADFSGECVLCAVNRIFAGRCNKKIRRFAGKKEASGSQYMRFGKNQVGSFAPLNIFFLRIPISEHGIVLFLPLEENLRIIRKELRSLKYFFLRIPVSEYGIVLFLPLEESLRIIRKELRSFCVGNIGYTGA